LSSLKIDAGFGVGTKKPKIVEFLNGDSWWNGTTRTKKEKGFISFGIDSRLVSLSPTKLFY
jgi:hypothetical protein